MKAILLAIFITLSGSAFCQDTMEQVMENRAKELIRVIGLASKDEYRKFIKENYTQALIERQVKQRTQGPDGSSETTEAKTTDPIEAKVKIFERLHGDIGNGKILSMKHNGEKLDVDVQGESGGNLKFAMTFLKEKPYLIDGLGVQMSISR